MKEKAGDWVRERRERSVSFLFPFHSLFHYTFSALFFSYQYPSLSPEGVTRLLLENLLLGKKEKIEKKIEIAPLGNEMKRYILFSNLSPNPTNGSKSKKRV